MPKIVEGFARTIAYLLAATIFLYAVTTAIIWISRVIDTVDEASMNTTGLPAKSIKPIATIETAAAIALPVIPISAIGILVVYFIHRPRR